MIRCVPCTCSCIYSVLATEKLNEIKIIEYIFSVFATNSGFGRCVSWKLMNFHRNKERSEWKREREKQKNNSNEIVTVHNTYEHNKSKELMLNYLTLPPHTLFTLPHIHRHTDTPSERERSSILHTVPFSLYTYDHCMYRKDAITQRNMALSIRFFVGWKRGMRVGRMRCRLKARVNDREWEEATAEWKWKMHSVKLNNSRLLLQKWCILFSGIIFFALLLLLFCVSFRLRLFGFFPHAFVFLYHI